MAGHSPVEDGRERPYVPAILLGKALLPYARSPGQARWAEIAERARHPNIDKGGGNTGRSFCATP